MQKSQMSTETKENIKVVGSQPRQTFITKQQREILKSLSKEVFGVSSKYQRYLDGISQLQTKKAMQTVPGENGAPDTEQEVEVAILMANGSKIYKTKFFTFEETLKIFQDYKVTKDEYLAKMKAQEEAKKAKEVAAEVAKTVQDAVAGSAI